MSRFIRWKGLVGFFVVMGLMIAFILLFAVGLVK
jgi:hypothetical protein